MAKPKKKVRIGEKEDLDINRIKQFVKPSATQEGDAEIGGAGFCRDAEVTVYLADGATKIGEAAVTFDTSERIYFSLKLGPGVPPDDDKIVKVKCGNTEVASDPTKPDEVFETL